MRVNSLIFAAGEGVKSVLGKSTCWGNYLFTENMSMHCKTPVAMWVTADVQPFVWVFVGNGWPPGEEFMHFTKLENKIMNTLSWAAVNLFMCKAWRGYQL